SPLDDRKSENKSLGSTRSAGTLKSQRCGVPRYERSPLQLHLTTPAFPIDPGKAESSETNANQKNNSQAQHQNHNRTEPAGKKALPVS
ncbi:MAG: hypothetical protein ACPHF4_08870, partial [Rubripirellula sp.]